MTKLCPRGKAAAKRKFKVYPSAYANAYASKICAGKIKDPSGVKRKDFRGSKAEGGLMEATSRLKRQGLKEGGNSKSRTNPDNLTGKQEQELSKLGLLSKSKLKMNPKLTVVKSGKIDGPVKGVLRNTFERSIKPKPKKPNRSRPKFKAMGGRINYRKGGGVCLRGMNRDAIGKNS